MSGVRGSPRGDTEHVELLADRALRKTDEVHDLVNEVHKSVFSKEAPDSETTEELVSTIEELEDAAVLLASRAE